MDLKAIRILVVDDELFFRKVLKDMLTQMGFTVVAEAADGNDAVQKFRQFRPHVTIMDIYMPEKNGIEATREIVALEQNAAVLVCSASDFDSDTEAAIAVGAKGTLLKPFAPKEVYQGIAKALSARKG